MRKIAVGVVCVAVLCCGGHAFADMLGSTVTSQYYFFGGPYNAAGSPTTFVANGTVQQTFCGNCSAGFDLTVGGSQIVYAMSGTPGSGWSSSVVSLNSNGLFIENGNLLTFSGVAINSVTVDSATTMPGFTASNVTFNSSNIAVNWANLMATGYQVVLDVTSTAPTTAPEPATLPLVLLGTGFTGLMTMIRRRLRK